jgi:transposase
MKKISTLGVDLAKNEYQVCGMNQSGKVLFNRKLGRSKFIEFVCTLDIAADFHVAMEACGGANHVAHTL